VLPKTILDFKTLVPEDTPPSDRARIIFGAIKENWKTKHYEHLSNEDIVEFIRDKGFSPLVQQAFVDHAIAGLCIKDLGDKEFLQQMGIKIQETG
jgi:hypothetical protein